MRKNEIKVTCDLCCVSTRPEPLTPYNIQEAWLVVIKNGVEIDVCDRCASAVDAAVRRGIVEAVVEGGNEAVKAISGCTHYVKAR